MTRARLSDVLQDCSNKTGYQACVYHSRQACFKLFQTCWQHGQLVRTPFVDGLLAGLLKAYVVRFARV